MTVERKKVEPAGPLALAPREAARAIGVSERTLWTYTRTQGVPHVRLGRRILYPVRELTEWLASRATAGDTVAVAAASPND
jgi:excisionase family DNA binding protein